MAAVFQADGHPLKIRVEIKGSVDKLDSANFPTVRYKLRSEALVIKYGAGRHLNRDVSPAKETDAPKTSFSEVTVLYDARRSSKS